MKEGKVNNVSFMKERKGFHEMKINGEMGGDNNVNKQISLKKYNQL